jgi:O-antigen ligase
MTVPGEEHSHRSVPPASLAATIMVAWMLAIPLSTAIAEILLASGIVIALFARTRAGTDDSWPMGWRSLLQGGPGTRAVPWLWTAFLAWYLVSIVFAIEPSKGLESIPKLNRYALFFIPLAVPWRAWHWRAAFWVQVLLTVILGWLAIGVMSQGVQRAATQNLHYNTLAQLAAMSSLLMLAAGLYGPSSARGERIVFFLGSAASAAVMVLTLSRAAWLAWWLGVIVLVLFRIPRRAALVTLSMLIVIPLLAIPTMQATRADMFDLDHPEFTRRYDMWRMAITIVKDHPLTGLGPGGLAITYDEYKTGVLVDDPRVWLTSHNDLLTVAVRHGVPAAATWVGLATIMYVGLVRRLWQFQSSPGTWLKAGFAGAGACLHLFFLFGLVHDNYNIFLKINLMLLMWGVFVATDRVLGLPPKNGA